MKRFSAVTRWASRNQVKGDQPLGAGTVLVLGPIHGKGDAHPPKDGFGLVAPRLHHVARLFGKPSVIALVVRSHFTGSGMHFVEAWLHGRSRSRLRAG
jgi:hypothetical protein